MTSTPGRGPRTLTQMLRDWDDAALADLLVSRPDLAFPTPTDFSQVAARATTRQSVTEAVSTLNRFELWVAGRGAALPGPFTTADLAPDDETLVPVAEAVHCLTTLALLWGDAESLRPVRALQTVLDQPVGAEPPPAYPPNFENAARQSPSLVDKVAAGSAFEFVRRTDVLVEHCDHRPARLTRDGTLATREVRAFSGLLDAPAALTTLHVEVARAAGLLGLSAHGHDEVLLPTEEYDAWLSTDLPEQWRQLAHAWVESHPPSGAGWLKRLCMEAFGDRRDGRVLSAADVRGWLDWQRPRRPVGSDRQAATMIEQAAAVGVTGLGALASYGPSLDADGLAALLPPRVDQVLVQADLTAIAPGPLTPEAARELGSIADVESRGGATVYRFSPESLRRARSLGWTVADILEVLDRRSSTPIPQPLDYLIHDLDRLPESAFGEPALGEAHRSPERAVVPVSPEDLTAAERITEAAARAIVRGLRDAAADGKKDGAASELRGASFEAPIDALREAAETGEVVWFGFVDTAGSSGECLVHAVSVDEGLLLARDARTGDALRVPLHRITAAHIIRGGT